MMKSSQRWVFAAAAACCVAAAVAFADLFGPRAAGPRSIEVTETVRVFPPAAARELRLWIPKPPNAGPQSTELLGIDAPTPYRVTAESEFGNETVFLRLRKPGPSPFAVSLRYRITRRPQALDPGVAPSTVERAPRGLLAVDDEIRRLARQQTEGLSRPLDKGQALYRYVLDRMAYDKSGRGWGRGDSIYACRIGKGNCTDFHSLFMALALASGIPARFRMGFSVPDAPQGSISGYHCWAEFYAAGSGWVPVDISEAWKNPRRRNYYFGHLDGSRVLVSTGREIRLSPPQKGPPLNFLDRPYAEADGKPWYDVDFARTYTSPDGKL